ncbi:MAG TPA: sensor histidine kinase [Steroidobacteraceae bacterium]|nr:sensor histidine kinase [Steroidobacteraceae bacterium]
MKFATDPARTGADLSLRLQINLIIAVMMTLFIGTLVYQQMEDTRNSVREEIEGSNRVAIQLLTAVSGVYEESGVRGMLNFLHQVGRVRANDVTLYDPAGQLVYSSPASVYKVGRSAPAWYAGVVAPVVQPSQIAIGGGRLVIHANSSRAVLDGWDGMVQLLWMGAIALAVINLAVFWFAGRILRPLQIVIEGLKRMEAGDYGARLPALSGREGRLMSATFNRTAQAVADGVADRRAAVEARDRLRENREFTQMIQSHIEEERRTIARELHDELGQSITAIRSFGLIIQQQVAPGNERVAEAARLVVQTAGQMYDAVHEMIPRLRPFALDSFGLGDAAGDLVAAWRTRLTGVAILLQVEEPLPQLGAAQSICAYRILQEALTNAIRHAAARQITVSLSTESGELLVRVADDGTGLPPGWEQSGHYGMRGMRERADASGGKLQLISAPGNGTEVVARLPLSAAA